MQQQLINHNPDLSRLQEDGYCLEVCGGYLMIHHIPYVTLEKTVKLGSFVCVMTLAGPNRVGKPQDHTMFFIGETPCDMNGVPLHAIINNSSTRSLTTSITVNHYFSSKPKSGSYPDYYEKVRTYAEILSVQAQAIEPSATAKPNRKKAS